MRRRLGRLALALLAALATWTALLPAHEYAHCKLAHAWGQREPCLVTYYATGGADAAVWSPPWWWEHPTIYAAQAGAAALAALAAYAPRERRSSGGT